jgi:hypothetical protein
MLSFIITTAHWPNMPLDAHHDAAMVAMKASPKKGHYLWNPAGTGAAVFAEKGGWPFAIFSITDE